MIWLSSRLNSGGGLLAIFLAIVAFFPQFGHCSNRGRGKVIKDLKSPTNGDKRENNQRLFSIFNVVTFPNDQCTSKSDTTVYGTCYTSTECANKAGTVDGNCAAGFGVCCTFTKSSCGDSVTQNCTYITSPSYPTTYSTAGSCAYTVTPVQSDICQLRLDMDYFDITETTAGVCTDSFVMTGTTGVNPDDLCGTLTGQHVYIENASSTSTSTLSFTIVTGGAWKIKVSQIECSNTAKAPTDCTQYFTGASGEIKSFNFAGAVKLRDIQYTICIRRETGYCGIVYSAQGGTTPDSYDISTTATTSNGGTAATGEGMGYIGIPGSNTDLYSGTNISGETGTTGTVDGTILAQGMPFTIEVYNLDAAQTSAAGFDLVFTQSPCTNTNS